MTEEPITEWASTTDSGAGDTTPSATAPRTSATFNARDADIALLSSE